MKLPDAPFLTIQQVCALLGQTKKVGNRTVFLRHMIDDAIRSGRLKAICLGRGRRKSKFIIDRRDLAKFLEESRFKPNRHGG